MKLTGQNYISSMSACESEEVMSVWTPMRARCESASASESMVG